MKQPTQKEVTPRRLRSGRAVWSVVGGEWCRLAVSPATYLTIVVFLLVWFFLFFRQVFLISEASLRLLFDYLPWLGIILVPAFTMSTLAREKSTGTLEWLLTRPVQESEVVVGKWLTMVGLWAVLLVLTLPVAWGFSRFGVFDWGVYIAQLIGAWLLLAVYTAVGLTISGLVKEQLSALLLTIATLFGMTLLGFEIVTSRLPQQLLPIVSQASFLTHATALSRGVIDVRDVWYFVVVIVLLLCVAVVAISRDKYGRQKRSLRLAQLTVGLLVVVLLLSVVYSEKVIGRVDLTSDRLFSLEEVTQNTLTSLTEPVTLTLYITDSLPSQLRPVLRDVRDILRDYDQLGGDQVTVEVKNVTQDPSLAEEALSRGVQAVQFNQISQESLQVNSGYLGISLGYRDKFVSIPFVQSQNGLEYQLTSLLRQLTIEQKPSIAFTAGHGEKSLIGEMQLLNQLLSRQYTVETINLMESEPGQLSERVAGFDVVVVAGPSGPFEESVLAELNTYASAGGSLLVLGEGVEVDTQALSIAPAQHSLNRLLTTFGLGIKDNLIYDTQSSETVQLSNGQVQYLVPYPWWLLGQVTKSTPVTQTSQKVLLPWASEVGATTTTNTESISSLVTASPYAVASPAGQIMLQPGTPLPEESGHEYTVAAITEQQLGTTATRSARIVVIGDNDIFSDAVIQNSPANLSLALDSIAWLSRDISLGELKAKEGVTRTLLFASNSQPTLLTSLTYGWVVFVPVSAGLLVWYRRRRWSKRVFTRQ